MSAELRPAAYADGLERTWTAVRANVPCPTVWAQLERLARAGILAKTVETRPPRRALFELVRDLGVEAPRPRPDGTIRAEPSARERAWAAMKALGAFSAAELALAAGYGRRSIEKYTAALARAGYLIQAGRWRLRPAMNTGPRPPAVRGDGTVIDLNLGRQVWPAPEAAP